MAALLRSRARVRIVRRIIIAGLLAFAAFLYGGPVLSGGVFLLLPAFASDDTYDLPADYEPLHHGSVDMATGLYVRENEDLVLAGSPSLILRRTYTSRFRVRKELGIGTTHNGEEHLIGDGERFQWATIVLANGTKIDFRRTSSGTTFVNAMFVHFHTNTEWLGARLAWTGSRWAMRKIDGSVSIYQPCGPGLADACSIVEWRDPAGHTIYYRRDSKGRLLKMDDGGDGWIAFEYDRDNRVIRAHDSSNREVKYGYDASGHLTTVVAPEGVSRYTYTALDELATATEPSRSVENVYEQGRCIRQTTTRADEREPTIFTFAYETAAGRIVKSTSREDDGSWSEYRWDARQRVVAESHGHAGYLPISITYERNAINGMATSLTLTCPDRQGRPLRHSSLVGFGEEEAVKNDLYSTRCSIKPHPVPASWARPRSER